VSVRLFAPADRVVEEAEVVFDVRLIACVAGPLEVVTGGCRLDEGAVEVVGAALGRAEALEGVRQLVVEFSPEGMVAERLEKGCRLHQDAVRIREPRGGILRERLAEQDERPDLVGPAAEQFERLGQEGTRLFERPLTPVCGGEFGARLGRPLRKPQPLKEEETLRNQVFGRLLWVPAPLIAAHPAGHHARPQ
jgi:hypothetical protein